MSGRRAHYPRFRHDQVLVAQVVKGVRGRRDERLPEMELAARAEADLVGQAALETEPGTPARPR
ncbi:MAG: hypothetical protein ABJC24_00150 [Chloroflexota bacterium]